MYYKVKIKANPYNTNVRIGDDPSQIISRSSSCRCLGHKPTGRLLLVSARSALTFPASVSNRDL